MDIEELISNGSTASTTAASARIQELEAELAAKTEQIENLEGRRVNMSGNGSSESSLGDTDAVARAEMWNVRRQKLSRNTNSKCNALRMVIRQLFIMSSKS